MNVWIQMTVKASNGCERASAIQIKLDDAKNYGEIVSTLKQALEQDLKEYEENCRLTGANQLKE